MKSMTGFGRAEMEAPFGKLIAEIQSVNRKYLEVNVSLPREFSRFETDVRKVVGEFVQRGSISVRLHATLNEAVLPDLKLLKSLKTGWEKLAAGLGYGKDSVDLSFLMQHAADMPRSSLVKDEDFKPIEECLRKALKALDAMRVKEGIALAKDIAARLKICSKNIDAIEKASPDATAKMRQKLKERMEELFKPGAELDDRLLREVALFAERVDISEEITRFRSHIKQFEDKESSGRKMDFLIQEMGREINTIGSKSMEAKIAHLVVEVKSELEKVREQIQNIE